MFFLDIYRPSWPFTPLQLPTLIFCFLILFTSNPYPLLVEEASPIYVNHKRSSSASESYAGDDYTFFLFLFSTGTPGERFFGLSLLFRLLI